MKRIIILMLIIISIVLYSNVIYSNIYNNVYNVIYKKNYDGDTITVDINNYPDIIGKNINVRLRGIDTPEIKGKCKKEKILAIESKSFVESVLKNAKKIDLYNIQRGKYFRIVADVIVDDKNLTNLLLLNGMGVIYDGGKKNKTWCE